MQTQHKILLAGIVAAFVWLLANRTTQPKPEAPSSPPLLIVGCTIMLRSQREGATLLDARRSGRPIPGSIPFNRYQNISSEGQTPVVVIAEESRFASITRSLKDVKTLYLVRASTLETHDLPGISQLTPQQLQKRRDIAVIDFSEPDEFNRGHIVGSLQASFVRLINGDHSFLPPRHRPVVLACPIGHRSQVAAQHLKRIGYKVYNLRGGIMAWESAGLPLVRNAGTPTPATS